MRNSYRLLAPFLLVCGLFLLVACGGEDETSAETSQASEQGTPIEKIAVYTVKGGPENILRTALDKTSLKGVPDHLKIQTVKPDELIQYCTGETDIIFPGTNLPGAEWKQCEKNQFKPLKFVLGQHGGKDQQVSLYANESSLKRRGVRAYLTSVLKVTRGDSINRFGYQPASKQTYLRNRGKIQFYE